MNRNDDMRMYNLLQRLFQGKEPTEKEFEYVYTLMKQLATIDYPKLSSGKLPIYLDIAGKCYIFCMVYERMF